MDEDIMSVRARHKIDTISLIHDIAFKLVLDRGLSQAKIEDIASAAGISKRTFFNYYPTKEDAVLGLQSPTLPEGATMRFEESEDDLLKRIVFLAMEVTRTTSVPGSSAKRRTEMRKKFPELSQRFELRAAAAEKIVKPIVTNYLMQSDIVGGYDMKEVEMLLSLSVTIIRYAYAIDSSISNDSIITATEIFKQVIRKTI